MRSAVAIAPRCRLAERSAAAPNTYSDSRGHDPAGVRRLCRGNGHPAGPDALAFPRSRPFKAAGSSREGMSRLWRLGCGADAEVSSPAARGAGEAVSVTARVSQLVRVAGLGRAHSWDWPQDLEPVSRSPVLPRRRVCQSRDHIGSSPSGVFWSWYGTGSAAHPCDWLPATRPPTHASDSTVHWWDGALSLGLTRLAPVRLRLADPPVSQPRRSGPRRTPSSSAAGGTPPGPACGRRSTAPCRCPCLDLQLRQAPLHALVLLGTEHGGLGERPLQPGVAGPRGCPRRRPCRPTPASG